MKVGAAEAEGADARGSRIVRTVNPGPRFGVQIERAAFEVRLGVRRLDQRRRQNLVVQRERRLDQPGEPSGTLTVPDHGLHRAEGTRLNVAPGVAEELANGAGFGLIADDGAGAVCFDQRHASG